MNLMASMVGAPSRPLVLSLVVFLSSLPGSLGDAAWAQDEPQPPVAVDFVPADPQMGGKISIGEGEADPEGLSLAIPDLSVMSPVEIRLVAGEPQRPLTIEIMKFGYDGVLRKATTDAEGQAALSFRTEMGVVAKIRSAEGVAPFHLVVWVGGEQESVPQNVFSSPPEEASRSFGVRSIALLAGLVVVGIGGFAMSRRRRTS